jgi:curved DNA-binding protein
MGVEFKDYYKILGVSRTASADEIKKAYRRLAREHHPDRSRKTGYPGAEDRIKEINEAYEVLKDPDKRRKYDQLGANWENLSGSRGGGSSRSDPFAGFQAGTQGRQGPEFHFSGTGFSDFFEQFFGGGDPFKAGPTGSGHSGTGTWGTASPGYSRAGEDFEGSLMVTLEEALSGATRPVQLQVAHHATSRVENRHFKVRVPSGVRDGQRLRVPGKGGPGFGGGQAGDLFLKVHYAPHPDFRVRGKHLYHDLDLAPWEAVLGARVRIPTLEGSVQLTIPPGTPAGRHLRLRGRGLPEGPNGPRGDLHAVVRITVPETVSSKERDAWERLARESAFRPRRKP